MEEGKKRVESRSQSVAVGLLVIEKKKREICTLKNIGVLLPFSKENKATFTANFMVQKKN